MRGFRVKTPRVSQKLKEAREKQKLGLKDAADIIGITLYQSLYKYESGKAAFPVRLIPRACEVYKISLMPIVKLLVDDYKDSINDHFKEGEIEL
jgi:predicted transcriptional regulator